MWLGHLGRMGKEKESIVWEVGKEETLSWDKEEVA